MTDHLKSDADFQRGILGTSLKEVLMSDTSQIALIRKLYAARGNVNGDSRHYIVELHISSSVD